MAESSRSAVGHLSGRKIAELGSTHKTPCSMCGIIDFLQHLRYTPSRVPVKVFPKNENHDDPVRRFCGITVLLLVVL